MKFSTMSHKLSDAFKDTIRKGIRMVYEKAVDEETLESELDSTPDPIISLLHELNNEIIENTDRRPHARNWRQMGRFGLWVFLDDPAHRSQFLWALDQIVNERHDEFQEALEAVEILPPERWYVNRFEEGESETAELEEESSASRVAGLESPFHMTEKGRDLMYESDENI